MDTSTISIPNHAIARYQERVPDAYGMSYPEVEKLIRERLGKATYVYTDKQNGPDERDFYVHHEVVFVLASDGAVVTVYPVDYGFGADIDGTVRVRLVKKVLGLRQRYDKAMTALDHKLTLKDGEIHNIEDRLRVIAAEREELELRRKALSAVIDAERAGVNTLRTELHEEAMKLVNSKRYSTELLLAIQSMQAEVAARKHDKRR